MFITRKKLERLIAGRIDIALAAQKREQQNDVLSRQVRISMLQAQINPHFLYNALDCIRGQALASGVPEISEIAQALSGYFRYSVSLREDIVTLRDEISNIRNYVLIQKYRFGNRFDLRIDIDENDPLLYGLALPKLTLQPIIENAVLHAFSDRLVENALITVSLSVVGSHASLLIADNGSGMSFETYRGICDSLQDPEPEPSKGGGHGIALRNVHRRIALVFGDEYGLTLSTAENIGTTVEIHVPIRTVEECKEHLL